jgi:hypothetical protein
MVGVDLVFRSLAHRLHGQALPNGRLQPGEIVAGHRGEAPGLHVAARRRAAGDVDDVANEIGGDRSVEKSAGRMAPQQGFGHGDHGLRAFIGEDAPQSN